jgi:UDP:flavonoid glycosyltransferase YjiC (YdhE family)
MSDPRGDAPGRRPRILFVAEAVTLAHVARTVELARGLDPTRYEVVLASASRYGDLWRDPTIATRPIRSISPERFLDALARGRPPYDLATIRAYVREDLEVLREIRPEAVIGDFRLSLAISARVAKVPYLAIINAYWSPSARRRLPMPELPLTRRLGVPLARGLFRLARPLAFALHAEAWNRVRREHGLPSLGPDLRRIYTEADHTLFPDVPDLVPTFDRPAHHHYLGPILWSPPVDRPRWWDDIPTGRPVLYVTPGSSGGGSILAAALEALADLPVSVLAADLGRELPRPIPSNAWIAPYLPGREAARRARIVVGNGGSPTAYQALAEGTPVLGLASNMDQHLNMEAIQSRGAGILLRSEHATPAAIRSAVVGMLDDPSYAEAAAGLSRAFSRYDPAARLRTLLADHVLRPS